MLRCYPDSRTYRLHERLVPSLTWLLRTTGSQTDLGARFNNLHRSHVCVTSKICSYIKPGGAIVAG